MKGGFMNIMPQKNKNAENKANSTWKSSISYPPNNPTSWENTAKMLN